MSICKPCETSACNRRAGFTLMELVIVLALIMILGGAILAGTRAVERRNLQNASLAIQADIRRTQRLAVIGGRRHEMVVDSSGKSYFITVGGGAIIHEAELPAGIVIAFISGNTWRFRFLERGTISPNSFTITLESGNYRQHMTTTVTGGRVEIFPIQRR